MTKADESPWKQGVVNKIEFTSGGAGNQWTTIDGQCFATFWNFKTYSPKEGETVLYREYMRSLWTGQPALAHAEVKPLPARITASEQHTPEPWAYDEDDARIYHADGDVEPTIAYIERENAAPERVKADGYLLAAAAKLLRACQTVAEDCRMALSGEWDRGDKGFQDSLELLESVIAEATGGAHA